MLIRRLAAAVVAAVVLVPVSTAAEPVTLDLHGTANGGTASLDPTPTGTPWVTPWSMGSVTLPTAGAAVTVAVSGLTARLNYQMDVLVSGASSGWNTLRAEVLDPLDGDDWLDVTPYHAGVPAGFSGSNTRDGFSFAQSAGLERSAVWAGGSASVLADEDTNAADVLLFTGVAGASDALRVTFGLRDFAGGRNFLVRLSAEDGAAPTPEPASMLLIGTGLAGLAAARRRRRMNQAG